MKREGENRPGMKCLTATATSEQIRKNLIVTGVVFVLSYFPSLQLCLQFFNQECSTCFARAHLWVFFLPVWSPIWQGFVLALFWHVLLGGTTLPVLCSSSRNLVDRKTFVNMHKAWSMLYSLFLIINIWICIMYSYLSEIHIYLF